MKVFVDYRKCVKAGECYYNHPTVFEYSESGLPKVIVEDIDSEELRREADEAIEVCPAQAISLVE